MWVGGGVASPLLPPTRPAPSAESFCAAACTCPPAGLPLGHVECSGAESSQIQLPGQTDHLVYRNVSLQVDAPAVPPQVRHSLQTFTWRSSRIGRISAAAFAGMSDLKVLDLSSNHILSLHERSFQSLQSLRTLNLSRNNVASLHLQLFHGVDDLLHLDLSHNQLSAIPLHAIAALVHLQSLNVASNHIHTLPNDVFVLNRRLVYLDLQANGIESLAPRTFVYLKDLQVLDLFNNKISSLPRGVFKDLSKLEHLNLAGNEITSVGSDALRGLKSLTWLNISDNPIEVIGEGSFLHCPNLQTLLLYNSKLRAVSRTQVDGLYSLRTLSLKGNTFLSEIDDDAMAHMTYLRTLDLSGCNLTTIPSSLGSLEHVSQIFFNNNPWVCDCRFDWFLRWVERSKNLTFDRAALRCDRTLFPRIGEVDLLSMVRGLGCTPPKVISVTPTKKYLLESEAILQCTFSGHPPPSITWVAPQGVTFHWNPYPDIPDQFAAHPPIHYADLSPAPADPKMQVTDNGSLRVSQINRFDGGVYTCLATNPMSNASAIVRLHIDPITMREGLWVSVIVGIITATAFLLLSLLFTFIRSIAHR